MPLSQIFLTLSRHSSISSIEFGWYSRRHPVSVQSCYRKVLAGRSAPARPLEGAHERTLLMNSLFRLKQYRACPVRLIWTVLEMGGRSPYSCCFVGCCIQDLFNITRSIFVQLPSRFFSIRFVSVQPWKQCLIIYIYIYIYMFGLVSLFKAISTFVGYLMPKPFSKKNSSGTI